ncbi:hypothetical protein N2152v2_003777 [Parachlorella kessleri]
MEPASRRRRPEGAPGLAQSLQAAESRLLEAFKPLTDPLVCTLRITASTASALAQLARLCRTFLVEEFHTDLSQRKCVIKFGPPQTNGLKHDGRHVCFAYIGWEQYGLAKHVARNRLGKRLHEAFIPLARFIVLDYIEMRLSWRDPESVRNLLVHLYEEGSLDLRVRLAVLFSWRCISVRDAKAVMDAAAGDGGTDAAAQLLERLANISGLPGGGAGSSRASGSGGTTGREGAPEDDGGGDVEDDGYLHGGEWEEEEEEQERETGAAFTEPIDLRATPELERRIEELCSPDGFAGLAGDFWDAKGWGPLQSFLVGRLLGDGHRRKEVVSMSAQCGDVGALLQMLWMVCGLDDERCRLTFTARVWKARHKRLPITAFVTEARIRDINFSAGLHKYIPIGNKHFTYTEQHAKALRRRVRTTNTIAVCIAGYACADSGLSPQRGAGVTNPQLTFSCASEPMARAFSSLMYERLSPRFVDMKRQPALVPDEDDFGHMSLKHGINGRWHISGMIEMACMELEQWWRDQAALHFPLPAPAPGVLAGIVDQQTLSDREACLAYRLLVPRKVWALEDGITNRWLIDVKGWNMEPAVLTLREEDHAEWFEIVRTGRGEELPHGNVAYFPIAVDRETGQAYMDQPSLHLLLGYRDNSKLKKANASSSETEDAELDSDRNQMLQDTRLRVSYLGEGLPPGLRLLQNPGRSAPMFNIQSACFKLTNMSKTYLANRGLPARLKELPVSLRSSTAVVGALLTVCWRYGVRLDPNVASLMSRGVVGDVYYLQRGVEEEPFVSVPEPKARIQVEELTKLGKESRREADKELPQRDRRDPKITDAGHLAIPAIAVHVEEHPQWNTKQVKVAMAYTGLVMGADGAPVDARLNSSIYAQAPRDMKILPMLCCGFVHGTMEYTGGSTGVPGIHAQPSEKGSAAGAAVPALSGAAVSLAGGTAGNSQVPVVIAGEEGLQGEGSMAFSQPAAGGGCYRYGPETRLLRDMAPEEAMQRIVDNSELAAGTEVYLMHPLSKVEIGRGVVTARPCSVAVGNGLQDRFRKEVRITEINANAVAAGMVAFKQDDEGELWLFAVATDVLQLQPAPRPEGTVDGPQRRRHRR